MKLEVTELEWGGGRRGGGGALKKKTNKGIKKVAIFTKSEGAPRLWHFPDLFRFGYFLEKEFV